MYASGHLPIAVACNCRHFDYSWVFPSSPGPIPHFVIFSGSNPPLPSAAPKDTYQTDGLQSLPVILFSLTEFKPLVCVIIMGFPTDSTSSSGTSDTQPLKSRSPGSTRASCLCPLNMPSALWHPRPTFFNANLWLLGHYWTMAENKPPFCFCRDLSRLVPTHLLISNWPLKPIRICFASPFNQVHSFTEAYGFPSSRRSLKAFSLNSFSYCSFSLLPTLLCGYGMLYIRSFQLL